MFQAYRQLFIVAGKYKDIKYSCDKLFTCMIFIAYPPYSMGDKQTGLPHKLFTQTSHYARYHAAPVTRVDDGLDSVGFSDANNISTLS